MTGLRRRLPAFLITASVVLLGAGFLTHRFGIRQMLAPGTS